MTPRSFHNVNSPRPWMSTVAQALFLFGTDEGAFTTPETSTCARLVRHGCRSGGGGGGAHVYKFLSRKTDRQPL